MHVRYFVFFSRRPSLIASSFRRLAMAFPAILCAASLVAQSLLRGRLDTHLTAALHRCTAGGLWYRPVFGSKGGLGDPASLCSASLVARSCLMTGIDPQLWAASPHRPCIGSKIHLGFVPQRCHISALPAKPALDSELLQVLELMICSANSVGYHVPPKLEGFPFEMQDDNGKSIINLRRKYQDENIDVIVGVSSLVNMTEPDPDYCYVDSDGYHIDDSVDSSRLPLTVRVKKGERGPSLEFICTDFVDGDIKIDAVSLKQDPSSGRTFAYEGPDFNDLDKNMQKAFHEYLEVRGVSTPMIFFLHMYTVDKDLREWLHWLRSVEQFIEI